MVISAHARFSPLSSVPVPDDLSSNVNDVALVFEGGGMRASFSAGVAATLLEAQIHIGWVGGISAGSSCLANYLSRDVERTRTTFVEFAAHPRFGNWGTWLRGRGLFNAEWIHTRPCPSTTRPSCGTPRACASAASAARTAR